MYKTIIAPLDGSLFAEQAVATAASIARQAGADLVLTRVHEPYLYEGLDNSTYEDMARRDAEEYLASVAEHVEVTDGITAARTLLSGAVAPAICDFAKGMEAPLIVLSTHGRTGFSRLWLGSIADAIARHAATPVLMLRHGDTDAGLAAPPHRFANILVPLDGSDLAGGVLPHATSLARAFGSRLTLLRVVAPMPAPAALYAVPFAVPPSYVDETLSMRIEGAQGYVQAVAARLRGEDGQLETRTDVRVSETPATSILEVTALHEADTIAIATHGRGMSRLVVASVADKILRGGPEAVLVVRPEASA
jgi:nucleotide-binding universal stress UspA family protein